MINLTTADISDSAGVQMILGAVRKRWPWLKHLFADGAYDCRQLTDKARFLGFVVEVVHRTDHEPGFKVRPHRWVVARSFGWMSRWRRLVRDYETRIDVAEAMIHLTMAGAHAPTHRSSVGVFKRTLSGSNNLPQAAYVEVKCAACSGMIAWEPARRMYVAGAVF